MSDSTRRIFRGAGICLAGVVLDLAGAMLVRRTGIPLYLDSLGVVMSSIAGGPVCGILVGFLSNIINGLSNHITLYFGIVSVLNAVIVSWFHRKRWLKRLGGWVALSGVMAISSTFISSILTTALYGGTTFGAQLSANLPKDVPDKVVTVAIAYLIWKCLSLVIHTPEEPMRASKKSAYGTRSLRVRIFGYLFASVLLIASVVAFLSYHFFHKSIMEEQGGLAMGVARVVADAVDGDKVQGFIDAGEDADGYSATMAILKSVSASSPDISYVYAYQIREDGCHVVFDPDSEDVEGLPAGSVVPFDDEFEPYLDDLLAGNEIMPIVSHGQYGWLLTAYVPVRDSEGVCQCYAAADISMDRIFSYEMAFIARIVSIFCAFFILILAIGAWLSDTYLIHPMERMAEAAGAFAYDSKDFMQENTEKLKALDIRSGDEIERLYRAFVKTSEDTLQHMEEMKEKQEAIERIQQGIIFVMADLVESRDACTGNHVRNTAKYVRIIMDQMLKEGIYTDILTEEYIDAVSTMAPLHDVGKIIVPDAILNKNGSLTDEEFAMMKGHALSGGHIISQASSIVDLNGNEGLLVEAENLAMYHHEKWDGTGYPKGLSGQDIPLSARIMAVADVFDALVSKRSYKEGMPFETAVELIRQGAGKHFDPEVVKCFLDAEEKVRQAMGQS